MTCNLQKKSPESVLAILSSFYEQNKDMDFVLKYLKSQGIDIPPINKDGVISVKISGLDIAIFSLDRQSNRFYFEA
ncbi:MAG: hypothetical protein QM500_19530 [Methylococcales bacterium]